jgi:hypothetical protein
MSDKYLLEHPFTKIVLEDVRPILINSTKANRDFLMNTHSEYEFYIARVANRAAILISHCEQLNHSVYILCNYSISKAAKEAGITKAKYIRYSLENYIIRTQTIYDIILKLVDAIFKGISKNSRDMMQK